MCGFFSGQLNIAFFDLVGVLKHPEHGTPLSAIERVPLNAGWMPHMGVAIRKRYCVCSHSRFLLT